MSGCQKHGDTLLKSNQCLSFVQATVAERAKASIEEQVSLECAGRYSGSNDEK